MEVKKQKIEKSTFEHSFLQNKLLDNCEKKSENTIFLKFLKQVHKSSNAISLSAKDDNASIKINEAKEQLLKAGFDEHLLKGMLPKNILEYAQKQKDYSEKLKNTKTLEIVLLLLKNGDASLEQIDGSNHKDLEKLANKAHIKKLVEEYKEQLKRCGYSGTGNIGGLGRVSTPPSVGGAEIIEFPKPDSRTSVKPKPTSEVRRNPISITRLSNFRTDDEKFRNAVENIASRITHPRIRAAFINIAQFIEDYNPTGSNSLGQITEVKKSVIERLKRKLIEEQDILNIKEGNPGDGAHACCFYDGRIIIGRAQANNPNLYSLGNSLIHELTHFAYRTTNHFGDENLAWSVGECYQDARTNGNGIFNNINQLIRAASYGGASNMDVEEWLA